MSELIFKDEMQLWEPALMYIKQSYYSQIINYLDATKFKLVRTSRDCKFWSSPKVRVLKICFLICFVIFFRAFPCIWWAEFLNSENFYKQSKFCRGRIYASLTSRFEAKLR